jgi:hypothetical protein
MKDLVLLRVKNQQPNSFGPQLHQQIVESSAVLEHLRRHRCRHEHYSPNHRQSALAEEKQRLEDNATTERMSDEIHSLEIWHPPKQGCKLRRRFHRCVDCGGINQEIEPVEKRPVRVSRPERVAKPGVKYGRVGWTEDFGLAFSKREIGFRRAAVTVVEAVNEHQALSPRLRIEVSPKFARTTELPSFYVSPEKKLQIRRVVPGSCFVLTHS